MNASSSIASRNRSLPSFVILFCYALYLFRFGYGYGSSDQDELIPYLQHLLNAELFRNDWFVQSQVDHFNVRTWFVYLLRLLCFAVPPWLAVGAVYLASWFACAAAVYRLAGLLTGNRLAALMSLPLVLVATPFWTLGGNELVHSMLVPSMTAWAIGLWAIVAFIENHLVRSGILLGLATLAQALVGLQLVALLGALLIVRSISETRTRKGSWRTLFVFGAAYLVAASPSLAPLVYQQLHAASVEGASEAPSLFYIMAAFRNPHHYLFDSFDKGRMARFFVLLMGGILASFFVKHPNPRFQSRFILRLSFIAFCFCLIGYLGAEVWPMLFVAKLQLFKVTVLVKALMLIALCAAAAEALPGSLIRMAERWLERPARIALLAAVFIAILAIWQSSRLESKIYPFNRHEESAARLQAWTLEHTPIDALFMIPPSWSDFRSHARRSALINHKAFPYRDEDVRRWFARLIDIAPIPLPSRTTPELPAQLDSAYHALSMQKIHELTRRYEIDYIARTTPLTETDSLLSPVFETERGYVYAVRKRPSLP